jgi:hypothetical protein
MSINEAKPTEWDDLIKDRYYDNRSFDTKDATCVLPADHNEIMRGEREKLDHSFEWDNVNKPKHYTVGPIEVIDIIKQQQGTAIEFHYEAAVLKYVLRWRYKNGVEDLEKAAVYLDWLIKEKQGG